MNDKTDFPVIDQAIIIEAAAAHDANHSMFTSPRDHRILLLGVIVHQTKANWIATLILPSSSACGKDVKIIFHSSRQYQ
jgi:hypothetical protein